MNITFSTGGSYVEALQRRNTDPVLDEYEQALFDQLKDVIADSLDLNDITIRRRSKEYLSVSYKNPMNDFLRFKATERTLWVTIAVTAKQAKEYKDSPLFAAQKKKTVIHWKSKLEQPSDIEALKEIIIEAAIDGSTREYA